MDDIKSYLLSVIAAAIISGFAVSITEKKSAVAAVTKLMCGLFLMVTVISPLAKLHFDSIASYFSDVTVQADDIALQGQAVAQTETSAIIKEQVEAYILDKASSLQLKIQVTVGMSEVQPLLPETVTITGDAAPYTKQRLQQILEDDLGIAKENQLWE